MIFEAARQSNKPYMNRPLKTAALAVMTLAGLVTIALSGCLRDPYDDYEVVIPTIPGWEVTSREHGLEGNLRKLFFVTPSDGFLIGYNGLLLQTSDSGKTWVSRNSGTDLHLGNIYFVNENTGFISGRGADDCQGGDCGKGSFLLRTVDGGENWDKVFYDTLAYLESMVWRDASHGIGVMEYRVSDQLSGRKLVRTDNAGDTWTVINQAIPQTMSPQLVNSGDVCYLAGSDAVIKSTDFGLTWQTLQTPAHMTGGWYRIYFYNSNLGFIADNSAVYRTADGGQTWQRTDSDMAYFDGMHFYDQYRGFCFTILMQYQGGDWPVIVGTYVYTTTDGGVSWLRSDLFKGFYAGSLSFPTDETGYGINGTNLHTFRKK
jgi:photosystem II stability/assembly factor-like uncharacterized protein